MAKAKRKKAKSPQAAYFLSLTVDNVRCFGPSQKLDLSDGKGRPARWTIILGDNGVGKTTLLQALVLLAPTKLPEDVAERWATISAPGIKEMVRRGYAHSHFLLSASLSTSLVAGENWVRQGQSSGSFSSVLASARSLEEVSRSDETGLRFQLPPRGHWLRLPENWHADFVIFAYGAARRMGSGSLSTEGSRDPAESLFSEDVPLRNAEEWLLQVDYTASKPGSFQEQAAAQLQQVKEILIKLLPGVEAMRLMPGEPPQPASVEVKTEDGWIPMRRLSLGYRTMIAWMVDLASRLCERYPNSKDPLAEPAVVLIDEIDLHLHPSWQRALLKHLTERFPNTQFIVTAHSPLVIQAAPEARIVVLRRQGGHVVIDDSPKAVSGWRVDQILTSDLFDLPSARPPHLDDLFARRERILTKARLTQKDKQELKAINAEIGELPSGETPEAMEAMDIIRAAGRLERSSNDPSRIRRSTLR
jgi:predicted ATPase